MIVDRCNTDRWVQLLRPYGVDRDDNHGHPMLALNKAMIHTVATIVMLTAGKHLDDVRWWLGEMFRFAQHDNDLHGHSARFDVMRTALTLPRRLPASSAVNGE